jgi:hypothetical protein
MAQRSRINLATLKALPPAEIVWDDGVKGFGAKANANGSVSFFVKTRVQGKQRWFTIGKPGSPWTVDTARREALAPLASAADGKDHGEKKREERTSTLTLAELATQYFDHHRPLLKPLTFVNYQTSWRNHLQLELGKASVIKLSTADVARLNVALSEKPSAAGYAMAVLSAMMSWAEDQGLRPANTIPAERSPSTGKTSASATFRRENWKGWVKCLPKPRAVRIHMCLQRSASSYSPGRASLKS